MVYHTQFIHKFSFSRSVVTHELDSIEDMIAKIQETSIFSVITENRERRCK